MLRCQSVSISKLAFRRLCKQISETRLTKEAIILLQKSSENFLSNLLSRANLIAAHRSKSTLHINDLRLYLALFEPNFVR